MIGLGSDKNICRPKMIFWSGATFILLDDFVGMVSIDIKWRNPTISHNPKYFQCWQYLQPLSKSSVWNQSVSCKVSPNEAGSWKPRTSNITFFAFFSLNLASAFFIWMIKKKIKSMNIMWTLDGFLAVPIFIFWQPFALEGNGKIPADSSKYLTKIGKVKYILGNNFRN